MIRRGIIVFCLLLSSIGATESWVPGVEIEQQALQALEIPSEALNAMYRPAGLNVPDGQRTWDHQIVRGADTRSPRVRVTLAVNEKKVQTWLVAFRRKRTVRCFVTPEDLPPGSLVRFSDLKMVDKYWDGQGSPATKKNQILGYHTRRYLPAGSIVHKRDLIMKPVLSRGDKVVINLNEDNLSMSFEGVAQRPGYPGRSLPITTPNGKTIEVWIDYDGNIKPVIEKKAI